MFVQDAVALYWQLGKDLFLKNPVHAHVYKNIDFQVSDDDPPPPLSPDLPSLFTFFSSAGLRVSLLPSSLPPPLPSLSTPLTSR